MTDSSLFAYIDFYNFAFMILYQEMACISLPFKPELVCDLQQKWYELQSEASRGRAYFHLFL